MRAKPMMMAAAMTGMLSVVLGAFAAHGLKKIMSEHAIGVFETGVKYQFYHAFALMFAGLLAKDRQTAAIQWAGFFFIFGIFLFSGSLYLLAFLEQQTWLGMITPLGGVSFIAGWIAIFMHVQRT